MICSKTLREQGKPYPRTCAVHGLGPCIDGTGAVKCSRCGKRVSSPVPLDIIVRAWVECPECIEKQPDVEEQRDAWRAACRYLYEVIGEGGVKGRPMDLISRGDYGRIIAMIGKAESLEAE